MEHTFSPSTTSLQPCSLTDDEKYEQQLIRTVGHHPAYAALLLLQRYINNAKLEWELEVTVTTIQISSNVDDDDNQDVIR